MAGDKGAKGWAAWESSQGVNFQSPANTGLAPSDRSVATSEEGVTESHEGEGKGGWGEWVPLMPETPQEPKPVPSAEGDEAAAAADEVSIELMSLDPCHDALYYCSCVESSYMHLQMPIVLPTAPSETLITTPSVRLLGKLCRALACAACIHRHGFSSSPEPIRFLCCSFSIVSRCLQAADEAEAEQEEGELVEVVPEPTDEELLTQLGLQLEQQMASLTANDELPAGIMQQWAEEELWRDGEQWHPSRQLADQDSDEEEDGGGDAAEAVSFQDIRSSMLGPCRLLPPSPQNPPLPPSPPPPTC